LVNLYQDALLELAPQVSVPFQEYPGITAAHIMPILLPEDVNRLEFMDHLKKNGIQTSIHYPPIHTFSSYNSGNKWQLPLTEKVASLEVTLPLYPTMSDENVLEVVTAISQVVT
jgi:dTDP-4-amino-4,6-dideoxygalactose transaminase